MKNTFTKTIFTFFLFFFSLNSNSQIINTIAGNGVAGFSGDGAPAINAQLNGPFELAVDTTGNIYFVDYNNSRIRKINIAGVISTIAGTGVNGFSGDGGMSTSAQLNNPIGIAVDRAGNVYIADQINSRIRKINTSGIISTFAGNGIYGYSGDGGAATAAQLKNPVGVAVDNLDNVYIVDEYSATIRKVNTLGIISTVAGTGVNGFTGDGGVAINAQLNSPEGVCIDALGNMYISDTYNFRIRKVNTSGIISTFAGTGVSGYSGDGGIATTAQLNYPSEIAVDGAGNLFIADYNIHRIRKINSIGIISTISGTGLQGYSGDGGVAISAQLNTPWGAAVDKTGNLYIADTGNNRIRKVTIVAGIEEYIKNNSDFSIYPNPANSFLFINSKTDQQKEIILSNVLGDEVYRSKLQSDLKIDLQKFSVGIYFLTIHSEKSLITEKIIVTR